MLEQFFNWLDKPLNALSFFSIAAVVCWSGALYLRQRREQFLRVPSRAGRRSGYRLEAGRSRRRRRPARAGLLMTTGISRSRNAHAPATEIPAPLPIALPLDTWWPQIVNSPIAVMIVGESQAGKSTTARALLAERARTDQIVILDPHEKFNDWGGLQEAVIGRDRDLGAIVTAIVELHTEFERRFKRDEHVSTGLSIFIDEMPAIIAAAPQVADYLAAWLLEGAKAKFRVVFLTQEPGVEALGFKGKGRVRLSTRKILLGAYAAGVPGVHRWPAAIDTQGTVRSVDASALPALAARAQSLTPEVMWRVPVEPVREDDDHADLPTFDRTSSAHPRLVLADTNALHAGSDGISDDTLIAELVRRGVSANKIRDVVGGTKSVVLDRVRAVRSRVSQ